MTLTDASLLTGSHPQSQVVFLWIGNETRMTVLATSHITARLDRPINITLLLTNQVKDRSTHTIHEHKTLKLSWLWRWLPLWLSKRQSKSTTTVILSTSLTWMILLHHWGFDDYSFGILEEISNETEHFMRCICLWWLGLKKINVDPSKNRTYAPAVFFYKLRLVTRLNMIYTDQSRKAQIAQLTNQNWKRLHVTCSKRGKINADAQVAIYFP